MTKPLFIQSTACTSHVNCHVCRDKEGGRPHREGWGTVLELPDGAPDFDCPYGIPWGAEPQTTLQREAAERTKQAQRLTWRQAAKRIASGAAGIAKAKLGIDPAPTEVRAARLAVCEQCPESVPRDKPVAKRSCGPMLMAKGKTCGCLLANKTAVGGAVCPLERW